MVEEERASFFSATLHAKNDGRSMILPPA